MCVQGDVVGCRVKFSADGVLPESITWTRNGRLVGSKSIARIPGLSSASSQLYFSLGLNRPGEKVLVSKGVSPDLPDNAGSSARCSAQTRTLDTTDLAQGLSWPALMRLNSSAAFQGTGAGSSLCLQPCASEHSALAASAEPTRSRPDARALYREPLDFSAGCSSFRTRFSIELSGGMAPKPAQGPPPLACAFVLQYDGAVDAVTPAASDKGTGEGDAARDRDERECSSCSAGHVRISVVKAPAEAGGRASRHQDASQAQVAPAAAADVTQAVSLQDFSGFRLGGSGSDAGEAGQWQVQVLAGDRILAVTALDAHGDALHVWIEYAADSQLLSVFTSAISRGSTHPPPRPDTAALRAHIDLVSHIGDRALIGFRCEPFRAGLAATDTHQQGSANHSRPAAVYVCEGVAEVPGEGAMYQYRIGLWNFEMVDKSSAGSNDGSRVRDASCKELSAVLSALLEIGQGSLVREALLQPRWQPLMWKLVFSSDLALEVRSHALHVVALALKQPDPDASAAPQSGAGAAASDTCIDGASARQNEASPDARQTQGRYSKLAALGPEALYHPASGDKGLHVPQAVVVLANNGEEESGRCQSQEEIRDAHRASLEKLLELVASLSPEAAIVGASGAVDATAAAAEDAGTASAECSSHAGAAEKEEAAVASRRARVGNQPSVVTWWLAGAQGRGDGETAGDRSAEMNAARRGFAQRGAGRAPLPAGVQAAVPSFPSLEFRQEVILLIKQLSALPYRRACVTSVMVSALRRVTARCCAGPPPGAIPGRTSDSARVCLAEGADLSSVLVLGGVLDMFVVRDLQQDPDDFANTVTFDDEVFDALFALAAGLLASGEPLASAALEAGARDGTAALVLQVLRTRTVKAIWGLVAVPRLRAIVSAKYPDLIRVLVNISETPIPGVPLTYLPPPCSLPQRAGGGADTKGLLSFDVSSVCSSRVYLTNNGKTCDIRSGADCSVLVGSALHKGSGRHYCEFKILFTRGDYSFIGCAVSSYRTSMVIGDERGSWAWANDGDFKVGGDWCGDRGLASFRSGDHVGVLIDMDKNTVRFTKNGKLLRKACSLGSACATADGVRFAVGATSHLKVEVADTFKYKFQRESAALSDAVPWLTVEMIVAKSHFLALEAAGARHQPEAASVREGVDGAKEGVGLGSPAAPACGWGARAPTGGAGGDATEARARATAEAAARAAEERRRTCAAAARFLESESGSGAPGELSREGGAAGRSRDGVLLGDALLQKGNAEEVLFPDAAGAAGGNQSRGVSGAGGGAGGAAQAVSPWQTRGSKLLLLFQCEVALLGHFARLCVLDLLRSRHLETAMRVDAVGCCVVYDS